MLTCHLLTPSADFGDAVTNDVLGMRNALRGSGIAAFAYAEHVAPVLCAEVLPLSEYETNGFQAAADFLIYHHSTLWERGEKLYRTTCNKKILRYHNITPSEFFAPYSSLFTNAAKQGRNQTRRLVHLSTDMYLGDSLFNLQELIEMGADPAKGGVVFPFHHAEELCRVEAEVADLKQYLDGCINVLFVGRFVPNKGHISLLRAFAFFHNYIEPRSRLILIGKLQPALQTYRKEIEAAIYQLGLTGSVMILFEASQAQLRAAYLAAHVFLCLSQHEGFCVPLVEAMLHKIPIVALEKTAVKETLGAESLTHPVLDEAVFGEMMSYCLDRDEVRTWLTDTQHQRYMQKFSEQAIAKSFLAMIQQKVV